MGLNVDWYKQLKDEFGDPVILKKKGKIFTDGEKNRPQNHDLRILANDLFDTKMIFRNHSAYNNNLRPSDPAFQSQEQS